ncbi:MAG: hypothetical protein QOD29_4080, partial [Alphaproteobacteria bacterium]|nr:hypothetical protein [Alphaproteobacteria bacterium]
RSICRQSRHIRLDRAVWYITHGHALIADRLRACSPHERSEMRENWLGFRQAHRATPSEHSERVHIGLENGLVLAPLVCILLAQVH